MLKFLQNSLIIVRISTKLLKFPQGDHFAMSLAIHLSSKTMEPLPTDSGVTLFVSILFNETNIAGIVAVLTLTLGVTRANEDYHQKLDLRKTTT